MSRAYRETGRIRWPKDATERAMLSVIFLWHCAGIRKILEGRDDY